MNRETKKYYDKFSSKYDAERDSKFYAMIEEIEKNAIRQAVGKNSKVLDLACGSGRFEPFLSSLGCTVVGADLSDKMVKVAMEKNKGLKGVTFVVTGAEKLPFREREFDSVICLKALPHMEGIKAALKEIARVSKGACVLEFYNSHSMKRLAFSFYEKKTSKTVFHSPGEAIKLLESCGFMVKGYSGARIFTPFALLFRIPLVAQMLHFIEVGASTTFLKRFAGNIIFNSVPEKD